jgi:hypothetical protein
MGEYYCRNRLGPHCTQGLEGDLEGQPTGEHVVDHHHALAVESRAGLEMWGSGEHIRGIGALLRKALGGLVFEQPKPLHGQLLLSAQRLGQQRRQMEPA